MLVNNNLTSLMKNINMYYIEVCCVCLNSKTSLSLLQSNNLILLHKLTYCVPELHFETYNTPAPRYICLKCSEQLETAFVFKTMCIRNQRVVEGYLSELQSVSDLTAEQYANPRVALVRVENKKVASTEYTQVIELKCEVSDDGEGESFLEDTAADAESTSVDEEARAWDIHERSAKTEKEDNSEVVPIQNKDEPYYNVHKKINDKQDSEQETTSVASTSKEKTEKDIQELSEVPKDSRTDAGEKPYTCDICGHSFTHIRNLKVHKKRHNGPPKYMCDVCGKAFIGSSDLTKHRRIHSGEKPHKCDMCDKSYGRLDYLRKHQEMHIESQKFICDICGKSYTQPSSLKVHQMLHTGERRHKCNMCDKTYLLLSHLRVHRRTHTGEKPHTCEVCSESFMYLSQLKLHRKVHTGEVDERNFKCDYCEKAFFKSCHLQEHTRIHTGERPFKCDTCGSAFTYKSHLNRHIKLVHTSERTLKIRVPKGKKPRKKSKPNTNILTENIADQS